MINRAGNKEKAKRVLNENGNLSGMVGMEILYRVIAAITSVLLGAMIAGGIGVVSAVVSAPFKLFGLAGIIIAYLPRIYDVIESPSGYVYTIMDMIPGENMQNYVKTHGPVSQKLAYRWACQLCEVIAYLHSQVPPILHCDIKPSNIMITPAGDICVIDFNTSLVFSKGVLAIGATPGYAAPEQYTRPGASPDTIETVPLEETMPLRGYKDAFAYQNVRSNKDPSGRGVSNSVTAAQATNAGGYGTISKRTDVYPPANQQSGR